MPLGKAGEEIHNCGGRARRIVAVYDPMAGSAWPVVALDDDLRWPATLRVSENAWASSAGALSFYPRGRSLGLLMKPVDPSLARWRARASAPRTTAANPAKLTLLVSRV